MESNSLHPYKIAEEADLTNSFTTGITYHAYFLDYSCYHPDFANVYTFNIEPEQDTPHPIDKRIALTVIHILRQFFSRNENAMIRYATILTGKSRNVKCCSPVGSCNTTRKHTEIRCFVSYGWLRAVCIFVHASGQSQCPTACQCFLWFGKEQSLSIGITSSAPADMPSVGHEYKDFQSA